MDPANPSSTASSTPSSALPPTASSTPWTVRPETSADRAAVRAVHLAAFPGPDEADLVDRLREDDGWLPGLSVVGCDAEGAVVGHALLTRCRIDGSPAACLAPVGVLPAHQGDGLGSAMIPDLLARAEAQGERLVVVLGHPDYYPRFGFEPAAPLGVRVPFEVPEGALMVHRTDARRPVPRGLVAYADPFGLVTD